jgi:hypothetical protein
MEPVKLPFNGTAQGINDPLPPAGDPNRVNHNGKSQVFAPQAGGVQADTVLYVSVVFSVPVGGGLVILLVPDLSGTLIEAPFERNGISTMIAVPFTEAGLWVYHVDKFLKGNIIVATSL